MKQNAAEAARLLKALGNDSRLLILCYLDGKELSVSELNACLDLSQSALSQHLAVLRRDGLVKTRRESQTIYYSLHGDKAIRLIGTLHEIFCPPEA
ncbi:ArsR/SmtB family transcription factor [Nitrincola alkalisediminis]|uniref:ArsR/SmtB family transcription factor n=1 Tax=Nitrincola alkalisediminis TaxID=1366656 RepID=UPI001876E1ED|nr:metalloregulator ArsR/SmtB family transcription factor [Nitrincola alkalisediminis]